MQTAVGIDLGIRSGAVVIVKFEIESRIVVRDFTTVWKGERAKGRRNAAKRPELDVAELAKIGQQQIGGIPPELFETPGRVVGIDWGLHEAYWGSRKPALQKAFLAGFVYRRLLALGAMALFIPPLEVRRFVGLKANATKEQVQEAFLSSLDPALQEDWKRLTEHEVDAVILAIIAYTILHPTESGEGSRYVA